MVTLGTTESDLASAVAAVTNPVDAVLMEARRAAEPVPEILEISEAKKVTGVTRVLTLTGIAASSEVARVLTADEEPARLPDNADWIPEIAV